jgi:hypothetical protein
LLSPTAIARIVGMLLAINGLTAGGPPMKRTLGVLATIPTALRRMTSRPLRT